MRRRQLPGRAVRPIFWGERRTEMGLISNLKSVLRSQSRAQLEEAYLAQSTSQIDLEMRQREIDRGRFRQSFGRR
jgi:hypothetical protein